METQMDAALDGRMSNTERKRLKDRQRRAAMSDKEKYGKWIKKAGNDVGMRQIPLDITELPCKCQRDPSNKSTGFRLTRQLPSEPWQHEQCSPISVHPNLQRYTEDNSLSHFDGSQTELVEIVRQSLDPSKLRQGKKPGTYLLEIPADKIFSREGRERTLQGLVKPPAVRAEVVLYTGTALVAAREQFYAGLTLVAVHGLT